MGSQHFAPRWASFGIAALLCSMSRAQQQADGPSVPQVYCATVNTADMDPLFSNWQSDGRCYGNCTDLNYALAIVQNKNCWCSNLVPNKADRKPLSDCQNPCPGYPSDYCGGDGVFGYMYAGGSTPTGTAAPGGSATGEPSSSTTGATTSGPPSVTTITVGGTIRTVTAPTVPTATDGTSIGDDNGSGLKGGAIAGIVVGVVGGLLVLAAFLWFCFVKRRKDREAADLGLQTGVGGSPGRMATPKSGEMTESRYGSTPGGAAAGAWDSQNKRRSHLMPVDPRLDPFATGLYSGDQNRSRESLTSLQDNQDYSRRVHQAPRVLRATNPDPEED
ncbi:hypothetical protein MYCTH_2316209 [Thermothelomyces thermophilus ATCC 42464]|uniref:WSC domain-containing protein n=1 Tax=Thermothelomyces thermophilus (strain ATCC 42464 / BCRC 31852 / DSM 1799) TaxID=573729 RepID=G2QL58_THET4|nr:uncharacterized protein MYCTH_2316209 [Thermothelomyces thermophilus ATCC 42464]AEO60690.1 hypothetical protein MYCTH_2316209 [Thermothelomyces thermophilus ATCC 42464]